MASCILELLPLSYTQPITHHQFFSWCKNVSILPQVCFILFWIFSEKKLQYNNQHHHNTVTLLQAIKGKYSRLIIYSVHTRVWEQAKTERRDFIVSRLGPFLHIRKVYKYTRWSIWWKGRKMYCERVYNITCTFICMPYMKL